MQIRNPPMSINKTIRVGEGDKAERFPQRACCVILSAREGIDPKITCHTKKKSF